MIIVIESRSSQYSYIHMTDGRTCIISQLWGQTRLDWSRVV